MSAKLLSRPPAAGCKPELLSESRALRMERLRRTVVPGRMLCRPRKKPPAFFAGGGSMKTITEYRPLIFGTMLAQAGRRERHRRTTLRTIARILPFFYASASIFLMAETGVTPWSASFWMVFAPFFCAVETALREFSRSWN